MVSFIRNFCRGPFVVAILVLTFVIPDVSARSEKAPLLTKPSGQKEKDSYIVALKSGVDVDSFVDEIPGLKGLMRKRQTSVINGFTGVLPPGIVNKLRDSDDVDYVEENGVVTAVATSWGLDRINQRSLPLDDNVDSGSGAGVHIYVLDTGIRASHNEFQGRIEEGYDAFDENKENDDCHGHGTHCAGTAAGATYGVAPQASLHAVRVLNCAGKGSQENVLAGLDWVLRTVANPAVVSMSLGGPYTSQSTTEAVNKLHDAGVVVVVAAGNDNKDACNYTPAMIPKAITVAATAADDNKAWFSNWGTCVDIFAPGVDINSAGHTSDTEIASGWSGTSMACPHVAGAAALLLESSGYTSAQQATDKIVEVSTKNVVNGGLSGTPHRFISGLHLYYPLIHIFDKSLRAFVTDPMTLLSVDEIDL